MHDGAAGNRRQALALAEALALPAREWSLRASAPSRWFAPRQVPGSGSAFGEEFTRALRDHPPSLAIGCGRQAALATRQARAAGARAIQILDPRIATTHWDLVIAPEHDGLLGDNVIQLLGSLNPVDAIWLAQAREQAPELAGLPQPRTAVLLGGPTRATRFDRGALEVMLAKLELTLAREGGSLVICGSGRTPREWAPLLRARYAGNGHRLWMDAGDGVNPYAGALGWADRIVASPDSVNMVSEACATALPVFVAEPGRATGRVRRFLQALEAIDRIRAQLGELNPFTAEPLRETSRVAAVVRERLSLP
jgi:mitochondrial fission protein ELM1